MSIGSYINELEIEVKSNIKNDFNFNQEDLNRFTTFDYVNFYLIYTYILKDEKDDFFISIPEDEYRPNFFSSIFHSLVLIKLFQNYYCYNHNKPKLSTNDLVYGRLSGRNEILMIKAVGPEHIRIQLKFPKKSGNSTTLSTIPLKNQTKINPNLSNGRNTVKYIDAYRNFLTENFGEKFPFITDFSKRSLVIADTKFFRENDCLPVNYTNKKGYNKNELPFFNYLIECCTDFNTAKQYLLDSDQTFDEIIVIGDSKYKNCFYEILQECKWKGKAKNIILIGEEKPLYDHDLVQWLWSKNEIRIANKEGYKFLRKINIQFPELYNVLIELNSKVNDFKNDFDVDLSFVLKYLNFFYKILLTDTNISNGIFQDYIDRLLYYFSSDKFDEEFNQTFFKKEHYDKLIITDCKNELLSYFNKAATILQNNNPKWDFIVKKSKEEKKLYLIVEKRSFDSIANQIQRNSISNIILISDKRIDTETPCLDKWINDPQNDHHKIYIVPFLNNSELLDKLHELKGKTNVLCYEHIDEIKLNKILLNRRTEENARLTHIDREKFVKTKIKIAEKIFKVNSLDGLFDFADKSNSTENQESEASELSKEKICYEIIFTDNSIEKFESTKGVFLVDNGEQLKTTIGEVFEGAKIRFYQNNNPLEFKRILKIFDTEGLLESFDELASSWKSTLVTLLTHYPDKEILYEKIFEESYGVSFSTFKKYFDLDSTTRFPRVKVLAAIKKMCEKKGLNQELIVLQYDKFLHYSKKDHSIRQQAGRLLGNDLIEYVASNKTEKSETLSKLEPEIIAKLIDTIVEKVIKKKTISDEE